MALIKGITVTLYEKEYQGEDPFGRPAYTLTPVQVDNVLVSPASTDDITNSLDLHGKKAVYTLGIPKGDTHEWEDARIDFFGRSWHSFGFVTEGIEDNIPLDWNKKIQVEIYG